MSFPTDLEIAQSADIKHIREIADKIGIDREDLEYYGKYKAKIPLKYINEENIKKSKLAKVEFNRALHLFPPKNSGWMPKVMTCSSITKEGIETVWHTILDYLELTTSNHFFNEKRQEQNQYWMMETIHEQLKNNFYSHPGVVDLIEKNKKAVKNNELSPFAAAMELLSTYFK